METISLFFKICCKEKKYPRVGWKQLKAWRRSWNSQSLRRILSAQSLDIRVLEDILCRQPRPTFLTGDSSRHKSDRRTRCCSGITAATEVPALPSSTVPSLASVTFLLFLFFCSLPPPISIRYTTKIKLASQSLLPSVVAITHPTTATSKYSWHASEPSELAWFTLKMLIKQLNAGSIEAIMNSGSILFLDWLEMNMGGLMNQSSSCKA